MLLFAAALIAAAPASAPKATSSDSCPQTTTYLADTREVYRGRPPRPRKLTELPPGVAYMAVYRHIGRCEAPLTMADYRNLARR